jgi:hypothetical protein
MAAGGARCGQANPVTSRRKGNPMTEPQAATTAPRVVPTITQPVRVSWADWIEQILVHETPLIEAAVGIGVNIGVSTIPVIGPAAAKLIAPTLVKQVVDQGLALLEGLLAKQTPIAINKPTWLQNFAVTTINQIAPQFAKTIGDQLDPVLADAIAKAAPAPRPVGGASVREPGEVQPTRRR